jgi:hypothetical protein
MRLSNSGQSLKTKELMKTHLLRGFSLCALVASTKVISIHAGFLLNPSFESNYTDTFPHYGSIDSWTGGSGLNKSDGPFHNNGTPIPDGLQVAFKQGSGDTSQDISGLTPGKRYWIQFFYDARSCCGGSIDLSTKINGTELDKIANVQPVTGGAPYKLRTVPFVADADTATLTFTAVSSGDATVLFDAVSIVARDTNNIIVANPSFEASGDSLTAPDPLGGWNGTNQYGVDISGTGAIANNGTAPDQDHVLYLTGLSSVNQTVKFVAGKPYQLTLAYNAHTGNSPTIEVKIGDTVLLAEAVSPVGGTAAYKTKTLSFTAADVTAVLTISQTKDGDQTLLVDDVRITGEIPPDIAPSALSPDVLELGAGEQADLTVTVAAEALAVKDITLVLQSSASGIARFVDPSGALVQKATVTLTKGGSNQKTIKVQGLSRGSANIQITDPAGLPVKNQVAVTVVQSPVKNPSFESTAAPGGVGYGAIGGWTGGSGINTSAGPFADNGVIPDRKQVAFQQGAGTLSQTVQGLVPGKNYWLQFFYNIRNCCATPQMDLSVKLGGKEVIKLPGIIPAGDGVPYYFANVPFVADAASSLLEFTTAPTGDATLLLDGVNIVQRDPGQIVVKNPSFEASGSLYPYPGYFDSVAGWDVAGGNRGVNIDGAGPFTDNGIANAGDLVLFLQGNGSAVSQSLTGLTTGKKYVVGFLVNARSCCGSEDSSYTVSVDDLPVVQESLQPVGGSNPFLLRQGVFTATGTEGVLKLQGTTDTGDHTLLFDNVVVLPENAAPFIVSQPAGVTAAVGGSTALHVASIGGDTITYQWKKDGQPISGQTTDTLTLDNLALTSGGKYTVDVTNSGGTSSSAAAQVQVLQSIAGLFNTGVDTNNAVLVDGAVDSHYRLTTNPDAQSQDAIVEDSTAFPIVAGPWIANDDSSKWIGPRLDPANPAGGDYVYRTTLDLTGYDPSSVVVAGQYSADNSVQIWVNGVDTGLSQGDFTRYSNFSISGVFKSGVNQIDFRVNNGGAGPTGLRVDGIAALGLKGTTDTTKPTMTVSQSSTGIRIAWPTSAGFILQTVSPLTGQWANSTLTQQTAGTETFVIDTPSKGSTFYRLKK